MDSKSKVEPFLQRLAGVIGEQSPEQSLVIVLPNKRSLFKLKSLQISENPNHQFFTADQFAELETGLRLIEPEELLVTFYKVYQQVEKQPQSFDEFSKWAVTLLRDFNEVDLSLADPEKLFDHLKAYHETGEEFTAGEAGRVEGQFLSFWARIPIYYKALRKQLIELNLGYRGLIYRKWSEGAIDDQWKDRTLFWVGLVPGNPAERAALDKISEITTVSVFADTDRYYLEQSAHEAGRPFRQDKTFSQHNWTVDLLSNSDYQFWEVPAVGQFSQVQQARQILNELPRDQWNETAVILLDQQLLGPLLDQIRDELDHVNITLGYPLHSTQVHRFIMSVVQLHAGSIERSESRHFYHQHLTALLQFGLIQSWFEQSLDWNGLQQSIAKSNLKYISKQWIKDQLTQDLFGSELFDLLFDWPKEATDVLQRVKDILHHWSDHIRRSGTRLEKLAIASYRERLELLIAQFGDVLDERDFKALKSFIHRQIGFSKIFIEEPKNDALQIFGMLETRLLDFKNLIFIGASEELLPQSNQRQTFVPYMHRKVFRMPTVEDSQAVSAYHFYRLLQRASKAWFIYNSSSGAFTSGQPSAYILQLREELIKRNQRAALTTRTLHGDQRFDVGPELTIQKSDAVMEDLKRFLERKVSPSALNTFINSPLEFYFYYVLGLKEQEKVEEEVEVSTLGSIVHESIEECYKPFVGKMVNLTELKESKKTVSELVIKLFEEHFPKEDLKSGKNFLRVELAKKYVQKFLDFDLKEMAENGPVEIVSLEEFLTTTYQLNDLNIRLIGFADRIDKRNGVYRVIDYKTGLVGTSELKFRPEEFPINSKWSKALQLAFYKWVYCRIRNLDPTTVEPYIFSLRNIQKGYLRLDEEKRSDDFIEAFELALKEIFSEMLNPEEAFTHRQDSKYITI